MRVILCAAGSGGHIYPALRCADEIRRRWPQSEIRFLSTRRAVEDTIFKEVPYPRVGVDFPRAPSRQSEPLLIFCLKIPVFLIQWIQGCTRLARLWRECKPDIVVGFGGLSASSAVIMARGQDIPTLIHEQNAVPGRANRVVGMLVDAVAVGYAASQRFFPRGHVHVVGNPVRQDIVRKPAPQARKQLQLQEKCFTIGVMGGSQGARYLNARVPAALGLLPEDRRRRLQVVHLSGGECIPVRRAYAVAQIAAQVYDFRPDMDNVYSASDIVISRAGAVTLSELQYLGMPAILVPYPYAGNHQQMNARYMADAQAAWIVPQQEAFDRDCARAVQRLMDDQSLRREMAARSYALRQEQAASALVDLIGCTIRQ